MVIAFSSSGNLSDTFNVPAFLGEASHQGIEALIIASAAPALDASLVIPKRAPGHYIDISLDVDNSVVINKLIKAQTGEIAEVFPRSTFPSAINLPGLLAGSRLQNYTSLVTRIVGKGRLEASFVVLSNKLILTRLHLFLDYSVSVLLNSVLNGHQDIVNVGLLADVENIHRTTLLRTTVMSESTGRLGFS